MKLKILIADDHGILRAGLRALLKSDSNLEVVGEAENGEETLRLAMQLNPDIVLMDMNMPGMNGVETTRQLIKQNADLRVLVLTIHEDYEMVREAIQAGAAGYIIKRAADSELTNAIQAVSRGELYVHPAMTRALLNPQTQDTAKSIGGESLTSRELEVLRLLAQGYTNKQIAEELSVSVRTVETHRANITGKLNIRSRVELLRYATKHGLIDLR
ncbi:MAG TPA: response regulator transcription factor [Anaerolineales bacterium]|nr:response regulator transcription factor [Anaerolineales bacterium]